LAAKVDRVTAKVGRFLSIVCHQHKCAVSPWKPCSRRRGPPHFLMPISWHVIYTAVELLQPGVRCYHVTVRDRRPGYVAQFRNLMPSLWARRTAGTDVYTTVL